MDKRERRGQIYLQESIRGMGKRDGENDARKGSTNLH